MARDPKTIIGSGNAAERSAADREDVELMKHIAARDRDAFARLYERYFHRLCRFVARMQGNSDCIEDIVNDVLYVVWSRADRFTYASKVSTWIFGIAYNKTRQHVRQQSRYRNLITAGTDALIETGDTAWSREIEQKDLLAAAISRLTPDHRAVIELTYYYGMSYQEIADIMNCPENTIKTRMFHARRKLATVLKLLHLSDTT